MPSKHARAIYDEDEQRWVRAAQVPELASTAFTSRRTSDHITARLIVRRVERLNPKSTPAGQGELFPIWRNHAVFTDSQDAMLDAEATHRDDAIVEQAFSDVKAGALAHMPSSSFAANSAWTVLAAIAFNLIRATANGGGRERVGAPPSAQIQPRSSAGWTACCRESTASFSSTAEMWLRTVPGARDRAPAIWRVVSPRRPVRSTSSSRSVSGGRSSLSASAAISGSTYRPPTAPGG